MKKVVSVALALCMAAAVTGCAGEPAAESTAPESSSAAESTAEEAPAEEAAEEPAEEAAEEPAAEVAVMSYDEYAAATRATPLPSRRMSRPSRATMPSRAPRPSTCRTRTAATSPMTWPAPRKNMTR